MKMNFQYYLLRLRSKQKTFASVLSIEKNSKMTIGYEQYNSIQGKVKCQGEIRIQTLNDYYYLPNSQDFIKDLSKDTVAFLGIKINSLAAKIVKHTSPYIN